MSIIFQRISVKTDIVWFVWVVSFISFYDYIGKRV